MKQKIIFALIVLLAICTFTASAENIPQNPTELTRDYIGQVYNGGKYLFGADGIKITHDYTGDRDLSANAEFNLNGHTNIVLEAAQSEGKRFGLYGVTFKSTNSANTITINDASSGITNILRVGLVVDNATVITDIQIGYLDKNEVLSANLTLKNSGVFKWGYKGTTSETTFWNRGFNLDIQDGAFDFTNNGRVVLTGTITKLSANSTTNGFGVTGYGTLTIGKDVTNKILNKGTIVLNNNSTLVLNATNAIECTVADVEYKKGYIEISDGTSKAKLDLGVDNDFAMVKSNYTTGTEFTIDLNGKSIMTVDTLDTTNLSKIIIEDFVNGGFKTQSAISDDILSKFVAYKDGDAKTGTLLTDLVVMNDGTYNYLYSATAVPEPAQWAVILGAVALAFVAYRRRK